MFAESCPSALTGNTGGIPSGGAMVLKAVSGMARAGPALSDTFPSSILSSTAA